MSHTLPLQLRTPLFQPSRFASAGGTEGDQESLIINARVVNKDDGSQEITFITAPNNFWGRTLQFLQGLSGSKRLIRAAVAACAKKLPQQPIDHNTLTFINDSLLQRVLNVKELSSLIATASSLPALIEAREKLSTSLEKATKKSQDFRTLVKRLLLMQEAQTTTIIEHCAKCLKEYSEVQETWKAVDTAYKAYQNAFPTGYVETRTPEFDGNLAKQKYHSLFDDSKSLLQIEGALRQFPENDKIREQLEKCSHLVVQLVDNYEEPLSTLCRLTDQPVPARSELATIVNVDSHPPVSEAGAEEIPPSHASSIPTVDLDDYSHRRELPVPQPVPDLLSQQSDQDLSRMSNAYLERARRFAQVVDPNIQGELIEKQEDNS